MKNCEAYNSFSSLGSDQRIVTAKIKLSFRLPRAPTQIRYDWTTLHNSEILEKYNITLCNRYYALSDNLVTPTATENFASFIKAHNEATSEHIPQKQPKKRKRISEDPRIDAARKAVNSSFEKYASTSSNEDHAILQHNKSLLQNTCNTMQEEELSEMIRKVETADANSEGEIKTVFEELDISTTPFTVAEYRCVKRKIINGKAAGPDGLQTCKYR